MPTPLSQQLRDATAEAHDAAEASRYITDLMEGRLDADEVTVFLVQHFVLYSAMERRQRERFTDDPLVGGFLDGALERTASLERDLGRLLGPEWRDRLAGDEIYVAAATRRYVEVLDTADAAAILANHYVRYRGDLSGGQALGRLFGRHYGVGDLAFYRFEAIGAIKPYKDAYRARLDAVTDPRAQRAVVEHAQRMFQLNTDMFAELGARVA